MHFEGRPWRREETHGLASWTWGVEVSPCHDFPKVTYYKMGLTLIPFLMLKGGAGVESPVQGSTLTSKIILESLRTWLGFRALLVWER